MNEKAQRVVLELESRRSRTGLRGPGCCWVRTGKLENHRESVSKARKAQNHSCPQQSCVGVFFGFSGGRFYILKHFFTTLLWNKLHTIKLTHCEHMVQSMSFREFIQLYTHFHIQVLAHFHHRKNVPGVPLQSITDPTASP